MWRRWACVSDMTAHGTRCAQVMVLFRDVEILVPVHACRPFVHYPGSLTTPPCSEGVDWFVFMQPIKVPDSQILDFMRFVGDNKTYATNTRPLQLLNSRLVEYEL